MLKVIFIQIIFLGNYFYRLSVTNLSQLIYVIQTIFKIDFSIFYQRFILYF